jgi:hypothetical protein
LDLVRTIVTMLDPEEQDRLREMEDWIIKNEGTWVLVSVPIDRPLFVADGN